MRLGSVRRFTRTQRDEMNQSEADGCGVILIAGVGVFFVAFVIVMLSIGAGDNAAERDEERWALEEEIPVVEKELLENVDVDEVERYKYKLLDGESYKAEKTVAEKYGFECFLIPSETEEVGGESYMPYECIKKPGFFENLFS